MSEKYLFGCAAGSYLAYLITDDPHAVQTAVIFLGLAVATYLEKKKAAKD